MTAAPLTVTGLALSAAVVAVALGWTAAQRLSEPVGYAEKRTYRSLATPSFLAACGILAGVAMIAAGLSLPAPVLGPWWVLSALVVPLVAIDAGTTWLPLPLVRLGWVAMAGTVLVTAVVRHDGVGLARTAGGAAAAFTVYWILWRVRRASIGFGDVRLAPLLAAATAAESWPLMITGLVLGSLAGALHGMARIIRRRAGVYAYAPSMLVGPYAAAVTTWLW